VHDSTMRLLRRRFALAFVLTIAVYSFGQASGPSVPSELYDGLKWRLIGPFRGGRAVAAAGVPGNPTTFYFGAVNGGIWQTSDAGLVWRPIFDSQAVASIGALAVAPSDPKVIYAGTGEADIRSDMSSGDGVYKSSDGGQTWMNIGLRDTRQISRIVIDPRDANVVYVAALGHAYGANAERGVFKSTDGGAHWNKVLDQGPETGAADLAIANASPNILFATMWNAHRPPWSTYAPLAGPGSGLYRSQDGGQSWSHVTGAGLPEGDWGRAGVAVSPDGKRVYALIDAKKAGLYRSDDGGDTWTLINEDRRLTSRAWYFGNITVDAQNPDVIYVPNVALYRSEDGGKTIAIVRGAPGGDDYHQIWVDPKDSSRMVLATDQGTSISLDYGRTWSSWYNQPTAQLYHVTTDEQFPYAVYGAQQDSGAIAVMSRTDRSQITPRDWFPAGGSESGYIAIDPKDPTILYITSSYGGVSRFNRKTSFSQDITPWPFPTWGSEIAARKYRAPWTPVLVFSPFDKTSLYLGTQYVMKTSDGGLHWQEISPDLTRAAAKLGEKNSGPPTVENAKQRGYGVIYTIAPSALEGELIWAGSDTGLIHLTRDGGKTWKDVTPRGLGDWSKISFIEASHFDPAEAYAAVDRHRLDDQKPYLYRTRDFGASWQAITEGIGASSFLRMVREDPKKRGLLFAGTELGFEVSFDDGDHWQPLQMNLPASSVQDIVIHGDDLVIATHGRSFWILDDITPLRQVDDAMKGASAWLYRPATAIRVDNDGFQGTPLPPEEPTAANPPNANGAVIDYYLKRPAGQIKLEILDAKQNVVRSFSSDESGERKHAPVAIAERWFPKPEAIEKTTGMHRFVWNLAWSSSGGRGADGASEDDYFAVRGPRAVPGAYQVRLTVDEQNWTQPLEVIMDPRSPATREDLEQQLALGREIFGKTLRSRQVLAEISSVQKQLSDLEAKLPAENTTIKTTVAQLKTEIEKILEGDHSDATSWGLEAANSGLAAALRVVESGDRTAPSQAIAVYQQSSQAAKARESDWARLKAERLPELNQQLRQAKLAAITIAEIERDVEWLMSR
jgi:photosystem II stability/assembly factor-like uncharacterized protein